MTSYSKNVELAMVTFFCSLRKKTDGAMLRSRPPSWVRAVCLILPACLASTPKRFAKVKQTSKTYRTFLPRMSGKKGRQKEEN